MSVLDSRAGGFTMSLFQISVPFLEGSYTWDTRFLSRVFKPVTVTATVVAFRRTPMNLPGPDTSTRAVVENHPPSAGHRR